MGGIPSATTVDGSGVAGRVCGMLLALSSDGSEGVEGTRRGSTGSEGHVEVSCPAGSEESHETA